MTLEELIEKKNQMIGFDPENEQECLEAIKEYSHNLQFVKKTNS